MESGSSHSFNNTYLLKNCFAAGFSLFYIGFEIAAILYMEGRMFLKSNPNLSRFVYIGSMMACLTLGSLSVNPLSLKLGRRHLLILGIGCVLAGSALVRHNKIIINDQFSFFTAKLTISYGGGIGSATAPIYSNLHTVKEMSPREMGLKIGGVMPFSFVLGITVAVALGTVELSQPYWWEVEYALIAAVCVVHLVVLIFFIPDTPHWYYENDQAQAGNSVVRMCYRDPLSVISNKAYVKEEAATEISSYKSLAVSASNFYTVVSFAMATCGINFSFFFGNNNMSEAIHLENASVKLILMSAGFALIIVTSCLTNRNNYAGIPRKFAIVVGLGSMGVFQIIGGALLQNDIEGYIAGIVMFMILFTFEAGIGTFYWIYLPELLKVRRISLAISVYWGVEVVMCFLYYLQNYYFPVYSVYYAHGALNLLLTGVLQVIGIETLGHNWQELAESFDGSFNSEGESQIN